MTRKTTYPEIWFELGSYIHQDFLIHFPDFKSGIFDFCRDLPRHKVEELSIFVGGVLAENYSGEQLADIWNDNGSNLLFEPDSAGAGWGMVEDAITMCLSNKT